MSTWYSNCKEWRNKRLRFNFLLCIYSSIWLGHLIHLPNLNHCFLQWCHQVSKTLSAQIPKPVPNLHITWLLHSGANFFIPVSPNLLLDLLELFDMLKLASKPTLVAFGWKFYLHLFHICFYCGGDWELYTFVVMLTGFHTFQWP